ncbi:hypothetical protein L596_005284 [Steinernema carpocapsae]|uniref:Uncharacterized protein n=1 Tax=Steinernema carpocapsae TaxID=34508 RepID=A0A4U8UZL4_STECR|nr:hypothetical protein L596_005284 [Steinernema carpocapsae]
MFQNVLVVLRTQLSMALAIYGFLPRQRRTEEAGIMYETRLVREKIEKGVDPSPVYTGTLIIEDLSNASDAACDQDTPDNHFDPDDDNYLRFVRSLDPKDTKSQDHYKVLGLSQLRWKATRNQIKTAYRQKSLKHHPDKRQNVGADDYFVCITNAYNQLYLKEEDRRAYDSMDPTFDESVPRPSEVNAKNFYKVLHSVFEMNSRFSRKKNIPKLGDADASREHVEEFYDFWFAFDSWRDFSYADEEDKERGEDRWERRQIEKQNKVEREKKRKEEVKRIRGLVEMAYSADPRIQKFKDEDREKKQQEKEAKRLLIQKKKEEERLAQEEEERKRRQQEELGKQKLAEEKKQKDRAKKVLQQARRSFRQTVEAAKYWADCHEKQMRCMEEVERICLAADKETLDDLTSKLSAVKIYDEAFTLMNDACKKESENVLSAASDAQSSAVKVVNWTIEENQLLIKATNVFPAGTVDRWNQIAAYINEHCSDKTQKPKTDRDVIKQTKAVQKMEFKPLTNQNKLGTGVVLNNGTAAEAAKAEDVWSTAQQKLLEEGLKKFPTSDAERWDKIAALVEGKNKKDCMRRYKKLVQMIKDKKGAS